MFSTDNGNTAQLYLKNGGNVGIGTPPTAKLDVAGNINTSTQFTIGGNRIFISAGYGHGSAVVDVTPAESGFQMRQVWTNNRMKNKFSSSVLHDGYIYGLDEAILAWISAETGELKWKGGRYGNGQVLLAGRTLIVSTEEGDIVLDPFAGSNTTGAVAERLQRRWIAVENLEAYLQASKFRFG